MSERFTLEWTAETYIDATRLHCWLKLRSARFIRTAVILTVAYFLVLLLLPLREGHRLDQWVVMTTALVAMSSGIALVLLLIGDGYFVLPRRARRLFAQQQILHGLHQYEVADDALISTGPLASVRLPYALAVRWAEDNRTFIIYHSDMSFQFFPHAAVPPAAIGAIKANLIAAGCPGRSL